MAARSLGWGKYEDANQDHNVMTWMMVEKDSKIDYNVFDLKKVPPLQSKTPDAFYDRGIVDFFKKEIKSLKKECKDLKKMVTQLAKAMENIEDNFIEIRDIPYGQAKEEIAKYFKEHDGKNIDPAYLEEKLCIEFEMAFAICEELEAEGKIKGI